MLKKHIIKTLHEKQVSYILKFSFIVFKYLSIKSGKRKKRKEKKRNHHHAKYCPSWVTWTPPEVIEAASEVFRRIPRPFSRDPPRLRVDWVDPGRDLGPLTLVEGEGGGCPAGANSTLVIFSAFAGVIYRPGWNSTPRHSFSRRIWDRTSGLEATR